MSTLKRFFLYPIMLAVLALTATACTSTDSSEIMTIRDGGPLDGNKKSLRDGDSAVQCPNQGNKWNGWGSEGRRYPSSSAQHTIKFDDEGNPDIKPRYIDSKDGQSLRVTGTLTIYTNFDCTPKGKESLLAFDKQFAGRTGDQRPWEDWSNWQITDLSPVVDRAVRSLTQYNAYQLVPRAAQIQNVSDEEKQRRANTKPIPDADIADSVAKAFLAEAKRYFGRQYFSKAVVVLNRPELPNAINDSINQIQTAFTDVTKATAQLEAANKQKAVAEAKQKVYDACASCARQDEYKAFNESLPDHVTSVGFGFPSTR